MSGQMFNPSVSFTHGQDGTLTLTIRPSLSEADTIVATFGPLQVPDIAQSAVREATYAMEAMLRQALRGACSTCSNYRLVDVPRHGRSWHEHCPDCGVDLAERVRAVVPRLSDSAGAFGGGS